MKMKHNALDIPPENPFQNCKLARQKYADVLNGIVANYADGFVLAINNKWGTGKTTFVNMWQKYMERTGFKTLYFNAWENDFEGNPIVPILSELKTLNKNEDNSTFKSIVEKAAILGKNVFPALIKGIAKKYIDCEILTDGIENVTKSATDILDNEINEYLNKKETLIEFRTQLTEYIKSQNSDKPIIFIIDELDRCRPNYAVEVLEQIKHFFSVEGIIFVLSIDKEQLGHAIRGVYGSEQLDADEYLRRFIDLEYSLPQPNTFEYCSYLNNYFQFDSFFKSTERLQNTVFSDEKDAFISFASDIFEKSNLTLRQQEKIFAHTRIALRTFNSNNYLFPSLFVYLIFIKNFRNELYENIKHKKLTHSELMSEFKKSLPQNISRKSINYYIYNEAYLVSFYNNYLESSLRISVVSHNSISGVYEANLNSMIDSDNVTFSHYLTFFEKDYYRMSLDYLLNKIELLDLLQN